MGRSRMFDDEVPEAEKGKNPSPRTTIVGGRPPEESGDAIPVPTGIQRLLRLASVDESFCQELLRRRAEMATVAKVELTQSEKAILTAIPEEQLLTLAQSLPPEPEPRRDFLRKTAATAVFLLGGAALTACDSCGQKVTGSRPDLPPPTSDQPPPNRPTVNETSAGGGERPDVPAQAEPVPVRPTEPAPTRGIRPDLEDELAPPSRPNMSAPPTGIRPDLPKPPPAADGGGFSPPPSGWDGGVPADQEPVPPRPTEPAPTRGIRPDLDEDKPSLQPVLEDEPPPRPTKPAPTRGIRPKD